MSYRDILGRIRTTVSSGTYLMPTAEVPAAQREAMAEVVSLLSDPYVAPDAVRRRIQQLHGSGRLDRPMKLSALGVLAASPRVRDYAEAARLAGQQELVALEEGGPHCEAYLASADRHRGVLAFLMGRHEVALDWFTRALERERSPENLGNVLATLLRLGDHPAATELLATVRTSFPAEFADEVASLIARDDDLRELRPGVE